MPSKGNMEDNERERNDEKPSGPVVSNQILSVATFVSTMV
jgi:hypothetical protein